MIPALLLLLALTLAAPGLWLLRRPSLTAALAAAALLLLATAAGYTGWRLWRPPPPPALTAAPGHFQVIPPAQLPAALAQSRGRGVLLEFYADWCSSCQVWKHTVFNRPDVQAALHDLVLLQIDASELTPEVQQLLDRYQLAGLPALLVYDRQGRERPELRLLGEMTPPRFLAWIEARLRPAL